ncbi:NUDIX hydrolase 6-like protein [Tanacetum coccineum]|uniref:NUDIX hydrolase 6-like protein n=1 Tax=Tanacetum coccineum TaxID=301880 RepID=A0ABQ5A9U3_9ASTR
MEKINNFQQEPDENLYQAWEPFKELLKKCPQHYLTEMQEVILFYNGLGIPTRQILDSRGVIPSKTAADAKLDANNAKDPITPKIAHLKRKGKPSKKLTTHNLVDLFKEEDIEQQLRDSIKGTTQILQIRALMDAAIRNQGASIKTLEIQIGQISKVLHEIGFGSLPSSTKANPRDQVKSISTTIEADSYPIRQKKGSYGPQFSKAYSEASHIPQKNKDPGSFTLPCFINNVCFDNVLVDLGASVSVMPLSTYLNLRLGELAHTKLIVELADRTVKYPKGIAKHMLVRIGKFIFPVDFIILYMPGDNQSGPFDPRKSILSNRPGAKIDGYKKKDYFKVGEEKLFSQVFKPSILNIELNDLNEPLELRIYQGDDLMPTIKEGEVSDEDKKNGISHPYQKLKGFYKGVLNLGPDYIRDARTEDWLTRGHINMHEME